MASNSTEGADCSMQQNPECEERSSKRRKLEDAEKSGDTSSDEQEGQMENSATDALPALRFAEGEKVVVNMSRRAHGYLWRSATVKLLWHTSADQKIPYVVELDDGKLVAAPEDNDECIRLAARACSRPGVLRQFAVPDDSCHATDLRFMIGDRVAVQLDVGHWEEGAVVEVWSAPEANGKPLKTWKGLSVPYSVHLDIGDTVMVPFDNDDVIRAETASLPPQNSIAEQIGGTERPPHGQPRFLKRQQSDGTWICTDTKTGFQRPCAAPTA